MGGACVGLATGGTRAEQGGAPRAGAAWLPSDRGRVGADVSGRTDRDVGVGCRLGGRQAPAGHQREAVAEKEPTDAAYPGSVAHERGGGVAGGAAGGALYATGDKHASLAWGGRWSGVPSRNAIVWPARAGVACGPPTSNGHAAGLLSGRGRATLEERNHTMRGWRRGLGTACAFRSQMKPTQRVIQPLSQAPAH